MLYYYTFHLPSRKHSMNGSLYLFPADAFVNPPELSIVLDVLTKTGLAGEALDEYRFLAGDGFSGM